MKIFSLLFLIICSCTNIKREQIKQLSKKNTFLVQLNCNYQSNTVDIGIGLLLWDGICNTNLKLFGKPDFSNIILSSNFCEPIDRICPLFYKQDYGIFHFVVLKKIKNGYLISYNSGNKQAYVPNNEHQEFVDWNSFLTKNATGVRQKNGTEIYEVISVNGNFLKVKDENKKEKVIRWNDSGKLLIEVTLLI